ncbi:MAG: hypothetical protein M4579_003494 [Chaenotheca gracillima]|nr:MAG: hypothetical protein M4579_003494 [Chaenotheca gracillima]
MSLAAPSSGRRARSKSPGRRDRDRDKSPAREVTRESPRESTREVVRAPSPSPYGNQRYEYEYAKQPSYNYAPTSQSHDAPPPVAMPPPQQQYQYSATPQYASHQPPPVSPPGDHPSYAPPGHYQHQPVNAGYADPNQYRQQPMPGYTHASPPHDQPPYAHPHAYEYAQAAQEQAARAPPSPRPEHSRGLSMNTSSGFHVDVGRHGQPLPHQYGSPQEAQYAQAPQYNYGQPPPPPHTGPDPIKVYSTTRPHPTHSNSTPSHASPPGPAYAHPSEYQYAQPDQRVKYTSKQSKGHGHGHKDDGPNVVEIRPGGGVLHAPPSPGLGASMHRLSVGAAGAGAMTLSAHGHGGGGLPPGSPLLEAYHGTYQSISPMPSPMMLPSGGDSDIEDLARLSDSDELSDDSDDDDDSRRKRRNKKRVKFYDPEDDAKDLAEALRHTRGVDTAPLIDVLPGLTHDQMLQLRTEYKKHAKVGGIGINIAKHIKMKVGTSSAFGKSCYATALGKWESEAYWANFWYQSHSSRRELLIESLMGRTNAEIRLIKDSFSDKRYGDSLEKCMKAELPADKFRTAVLLVLEEKRQEEKDHVYADAVRDDVRRLHSALTAREGGETAMIKTLVSRSDSHIRELLRVYEQSYHQNFAKEMLRKSTNLVGETLAHILNGVINRPVRDALLIHQALQHTAEKDRPELLISRLVRFHWDRQHLERVKTEFYNRYKEELVAAVSEGTKGEFGEFCVELCVRR